MGSPPPAATMDTGNSVSDARDSKGCTDAPSRTGGWTSAAMISVVELCERLTTLGIGANLVTYLTDTMHIGNASAASIVSNFFGTSFILSLLGGFLSDTFLGRYLTIAIFTAIQASGVTILAISTSMPGLQPPGCAKPAAMNCVPATTGQMSVLYLALYLTALGTGGIKSSVSGFGSDQFDESDEVERKKMTGFFGWFFFFISLGSLLAVTVLVYLEDNVGRKYGYGTCVLAILVGFSIFTGGTRRYRIKKPAGSPITQVAAVATGAFRKRGLPLPADSSMLYDGDSSGDVMENGSKSWMGIMKQRLPHSNQFLFLDRAAIMEEPSAAQPVSYNRWQLSTLTEVEEVKKVARMLPIWATTIIFWTVHSQMVTFSVSQSSAMNRHLGPSFQIPAASLNAFFVLSTLLAVPIFDYLASRGTKHLSRISVGLALSIAAMFTAALVEKERLRSQYHHASMTVFWLVPQFFFVGAGEAFVYGGQLEFFLRECPEGMKTMSAGMLVSTLALGFFLSSGLVSFVQKMTGKSNSDGAWLTDNINMGRLDKFYLLIMALSIVNLAAFLVAARWYSYRRQEVKVLTGELIDQSQ